MCDTCVVYVVISMVSCGRVCTYVAPYKRLSRDWCGKKGYVTVW